MTEKHTPGPWTIRASDPLYSEGGMYEIMDPFRHLNNEEIESPQTWAVIEANKDLIANAWKLPELRAKNAELLEACKAAYDWMIYLKDDMVSPDERDALDKLSAAIAKAEVES